MRLSEIENEQALDTLADILEPLSEIISDPQVKEVFRSDSKLKLVSYVLKNHKKSVLEILALMDGEDPATYKCSLVTIPKKILDFLNDPAVIDLFTPQARNDE